MVPGPSISGTSRYFAVIFWGKAGTVVARERGGRTGCPGRPALGARTATWRGGGRTPMAEARAVCQLRPAHHLGSAEHCQDAAIYLVSFHIWKIGTEVMGQNRAGGYP